MRGRFYTRTTDILNSSSSASSVNRSVTMQELQDCVEIEQKLTADDSCSYSEMKLGLKSPQPHILPLACDSLPQRPEDPRQCLPSLQ